MSATKEAPALWWDASRMAGGDGYDTMDDAQHRGWHAVPSWGRDGWDLGDWPYVVIYFGRTGGRWYAATWCEGDVDIYSFDTEAERSAHVDGIALFYWQNQSRATWAKGPDGQAYTVDTAPPALRGPFSWARLDAEKAS